MWLLAPLPVRPPAICVRLCCSFASDSRPRLPSPAFVFSSFRLSVDLTIVSSAFLRIPFVFFCLFLSCSRLSHFPTSFPFLPRFLLFVACLAACLASCPPSSYLPDLSPARYYLFVVPSILLSPRAGDVCGRVAATDGASSRCGARRKTREFGRSKANCPSRPIRLPRLPSPIPWCPATARPPDPACQKKKHDTPPLPRKQKAKFVGSHPDNTHPLARALQRTGNRPWLTIPLFATWESAVPQAQPAVVRDVLTSGAANGQ